MTEIMYKVVLARDEDTYQSAIVDCSPYNTEYKVGTPTKPKIGKLFVFDTLERALDFIGKLWDSRIRIFKVEVTNPVPLTWVASWVDDFEPFWKYKEFDYCTSGRGQAPLGTYGVDSVTLIEEVKLND